MSGVRPVTLIMSVIPGYHSCQYQLHQTIQITGLSGLQPVQVKRLRIAPHVKTIFPMALDIYEAGKGSIILNNLLTVLICLSAAYSVSASSGQFV